MAKTTAVYARIDSSLKENAEEILMKLGVTPSSLIQMLYSQVVLRKAIPFKLSLETDAPISMGSLTRDELDMELQKGIDSMNVGKVYTANEVDSFFENRK